MSEPILRLYSNSLLSKWGFNDGDIPEAVYDLFEENGVDYDWHATLIALVRTHLIPVLDQDVEVFEIETIHNPIRVRTVDGKLVNHHEIDSSVRLTPKYIDVSLSIVLAVAAAGLLDD